MDKYIGIFNNRDSVAAEFEQGSGSEYNNTFAVSDDFPSDDEILVAAYSYEDYAGTAFVLYQRDGKLYEVNGGHCSCYGLEGQWEPEETTVDALKSRKYFFGDYSGNDGKLANKTIAEVLDSLSV